jgi:Kef-type K+ transport system membrane component KefB
MFDAVIEPLHHLPPLARFAIVDPLMAGVLLGPYAFGVATKNAAVAHFIAEIGKLFLMLFGAMEIDLAQFNRTSNRSSGFGLLTFTSPLLAGMLVGLWAGLPWVRAMLIGSLPASHALIAFPIVEKHRKVRNEAVTITIGAAAYESRF